MKKRPPIIVVLGHIDHGKTTLLSKIKKQEMPFEHGQITQSVGAFQARAYRNTPLTFIDTPGHESFAQMRARGTQGADIAVVVIAADEGIKKQTKEAVKVAKNAKIPIIIAINKMDRPTANPMVIKKEFPDYLIVEVSAKTGQGINELLDAIALQAEELDLGINNNLKFDILETDLDSKRGLIIDLIIQSGEIKLGDKIKNYQGKVKSMQDWQGKKISQALPGMPVKIAGLKATLKIIDQIKKKKYLNLIIKAKTQGSLDAILHNLQKMPVNILNSGIGDITDNDLLLKPDLIIGFQVKSQTKRDQEKIKIYNIIYELLEDLEAELKQDKKITKTKQELGKIQIIATFKKLKDGMIIGGPVIDGKAVLGANVNIIRKDKKIGNGLIKQLECKNRKKDEVDKDKEAGLYLQTKTKVKINDILEVWEMA